VPVGWVLVLFPAAVLLVFGGIRPEERFLRERFGQHYDGYAGRVRRRL
jgi:protein-S-isoprenylcysteine O-methyltransferase Ste14